MQISNAHDELTTDAVLRISLDEEGLLRVRGRLEHAYDSLVEFSER